MPQTRTVTITSGKQHLNGYLAYPDGEDTLPGIIIIHEIFGLTDNIKDVTRRFADQGYAALAVDLFTSSNRAVCMFRFMGQLLLNPLNNASIRHLRSALTYLGEQPQVDENRIGAVGFCMGGSFSIAWACKDDRLKVVAPFYGANPRPLAAVARMCPVVGSYPDKDFTTPAARKLDAALDEYHVPHDIKIYSDTKHSFFNDQGPNYNAGAAQDSWRRVLAYFNERLSTNSRPSQEVP